MNAAAAKNNDIVIPISLEWFITESCNLNCRYCSKDKPKYSEKDYSRGLSVIKKEKPKHIWIGGGEPLLVESLGAIIEEARASTGAKIALSTNMTMPDRAIDVMDNIDDLIISLDTADRDLSMEYRCVDPFQIAENIEKVTAAAKKKDKSINVTVNSVVYRKTLENDGIAELNDMLGRVSGDIYHILCPMFPKTHPESILSDEVYLERFRGLVDDLKKKGRKVIMNYPVGDGGNVPRAGGYRCYRRYFRLRMIENDCFSPCPGADAGNPFCHEPCNCAAFVDDILFAKNPEAVKCSPVAGRFTQDDIGKIERFVRERINPDLPGSVYRHLLRYGN
ncbi:MAG: radical SAM protein [Endomicrobiales bacterium]|nr:radical SAM protein [Endomicrobiales bacterium]